MSRREPRIPWLAMVNLQMGAALATMFGISLVMNRGFDPDAFSFLLIGVIPVIFAGALPPFLAAAATWWLATTWGRGRIREVLAVMAGALVGSLVPLFFLRNGFLIPPDWIAGLWGSIALCSALGFATWVLVCWRGREIR